MFLLGDLRSLMVGSSSFPLAWLILVVRLLNINNDKSKVGGAASRAQPNDRFVGSVLACSPDFRLGQNWLSL